MGARWLAGLSAPLHGARLLLSRRALWPYAALPVFLGLLWSAASLLYLWTLPASFGLAAVLAYLFAAALGLVIVIIQIAIALASPLLDYLAERSETELGIPPAGSGSFWLRAPRALWEGIKLLGFKLLIFLVALLALTLPVIGVALFVLLSGLCLSLDFLDYPMARRDWPAARRRRWLRDHLPAVCTFSLVCYFGLLTPGLGGLLLAPLVIGGTWLVCSDLEETHENYIATS